MNEEEKAIKRLKEITNNYSLNSEDLHYAIVLYHLIINLQQENQQLKEDIKGYEQERQKIYNSIPFKENQQLKDSINKAIKLIEKDYYSLNTMNIDKVYEFNIPLRVRKILKEVRKAVERAVKEIEKMEDL